MAGNKSFMTSLLDLLDDEKFMNKFTSKHSETEQVDVKDYLSLVEKILGPEGDQIQNRSSTSLSHVSLSSTINELYCEITCKALHTNDACQTMTALFDKLSSFSWDVKAVLTLSAFSAYYAEYRRLAQSEESDYNIKLAAALRGLRAHNLNIRPLKDLIKVTLEFIKHTVKFANDLAAINIGAIFYQSIIGVIGCSFLFSAMISAGIEFPGQDLKTFLDQVTKKYESFKKQVEEHDEERQYKKLKELRRNPAGIVELVTVLSSAEVYQCWTKKTVKVEELKNKNVMLLISALTFPNEDIITLTSICDESRKSHYEIMWVPIADEKDDEEFLKTRSRMNWYSCNSIVSKAAAKFIRKRWQFKKQTQVVVLNKEGEVVNADAMSMIYVWGLKALPFTQDRGRKLWDEHSENWLEPVLNFKYVEQSFKSEELTILYGSAEDSELVKKVDSHLTIIKNRFSFFRGFNINTERVKFLTHLERCIFTKMRVSTELSDPLTKDLLELYAGYKKQSSFGIIARGSRVVVHIGLTHLEKWLSQHEEWIKKRSNKQDFDKQIQDFYRQSVAETECLKFQIPNMVGNIPEYNKCPNCSQNMEKVVTFKCCHGKH